MGCFEWISPRPIPPAFDLRARGWHTDCGCDPGACVRLVDTALGLVVEATMPQQRPRTIALGLDTSVERARWLGAGFGDALGSDVGLDELAQRARRLAEAPARVRRCGPLALDLVMRDALVGDRRLQLNPREFVLLWRLADADGALVPRRALLADVLGLRIEPETNALAVHVCRLRRKLHTARLAHLVVTGAAGGAYALVLDDVRAEARFGRRNVLDAPFESGEEEAALLEEAAE